MTIFRPHAGHRSSPSPSPSPSPPPTSTSAPTPTCPCLRYPARRINPSALTCSWSGRRSCFPSHQRLTVGSKRAQQRRYVYEHIHQRPSFADTTTPSLPAYPGNRGVLIEGQRRTLRQPLDKPVNAAFVPAPPRRIYWPEILPQLQCELLGWRCAPKVGWVEGSWLGAARGCSGCYTRPSSPSPRS